MPRIPSALLACALLAPTGLDAAPAAGLEELRAENARRFTDPLTHLQLALRHRREGRGLLAFDLAEALRRQAPQAFRGAFERVFLDAGVDASDAAVERLSRELAARPGDAEAAARLGRALLQRGELDRAGRLFTLAAELEPDRRRHVERIADVLNRQGLNIKATKLLQDWDAAHPGGPGESVQAVEGALEAGETATARRLVKAALQRHPEDCELYSLRGKIFAAEGKAREAERYLVRATQLCPERARLHATLASFSLLVARDPVRGLDHYLDVYFLDPNHHDGDYVDARIAELAGSLAAAFVQQRVGDCRTAECLTVLLSADNPAVVKRALVFADESWEPSLERPLLSLLGHDDPELRAGAMLLLARRAGEGFALRLDALLGSSDPRRLGMAAQLAVRLRGREGRAAARALLEHPDEIVRFEALTALGLEGGPSGRAIALEHAAKEPSTALRELAEQLGGEGS